MLQIFSMLEMAYAEMPFEADECQVIYVDNGIDHELNHFVADNLPMLKNLFRRKNRNIYRRNNDPGDQCRYS